MAKKVRGHHRRGRRSRKRGFASWSLGKKFAAIFGGTITTALAVGAIIVAGKLSKIETQVLDAEELNMSISEEARERGTGYLNVALFGVDSREQNMDEGTLSDTIIIASLNRETLEVKMASVYRDTLLLQSDGSLNKANSAYSFGGPEGAVTMLNKNLDLDIEHYVTVDFDALIDVVDAVGGVDIDVQEEEISYICGYATEIMEVTGRLSPGVTEPGLQTLNGVQATAYARIRYTLGDDFKRTERQRDVLMKIIQKLQGASLGQINQIIDSVFPKVSTNFTITEIFDYALDAFDYQVGETTGFPFDKTTDTLNGIGSTVIPVTLESNVEMLHKFLYGDSISYTASSTVSSISSQITGKAGDRQADSQETLDNYVAPEEDEWTDPTGSYDWNAGDGYGTGDDWTGGDWTGGDGTGGDGTGGDWTGGDGTGGDGTGGDWTGGDTGGGY